MFLTVTAVGVAVVSLLLALTVLLRNPRASYNMSFAAFAALLGLWIPANFFGSYEHTDVHLPFLFFVDFTIAPLLAFSFSLFGLEAMRFYRQKAIKINRLILAMIGGLIVVFSLGAALHLVSLPIYTSSNVLNTKEVLYYPYNILIGILVFVGLFTLIYSIVSAKKEYKQQARLVFVSLFLASTTLVTANIVFPEIKLAQTLSYFAILITLFSLSYSIVRHHLFDIRLIVARSLAYILSLGIITGVVSLVLFGFLDAVLELKLNPALQNSIYVGVTTILVLTYPFIKRFFDRLTNRYFYRDAYDPQAFLDEINSAVVSNIELEILLNRTSDVINRNIKATYCIFGINNDSQRLRLFGSNEEVSAIKESAVLQKITPHFKRKKVIIADDLGEDETNIREELRLNDIAIIIRLITHKDDIGYIVLGNKKSGNPYSRQDTRILEIIAGEVAIAIQNALRFEEIQSFAATLQQKVSDATHELRLTNQKLRALDEAKDEFISMASHQLRTPLTSVKGYVSMVLEGDTGPLKKGQRELLDQAFNSSQRMVYLIADLLNVSRLRTGKFVIENKETYLPDVVEGEVKQLRETAEAHQLKLTYDKPKQFPKLMLDETKVRQVIMNFMDNAIYYTPAGGSIDVRLEATADSVSYTVTDTGVGVPKNERHHLFGKFYRAGNARKMRPDGTGLGLFMAKKVIIAQGGAIIFNSEEGKGSTFGFSFPRAGKEVKK